MKVLIFSAYYTPEIASSMYLTEDLLCGLTEKGHYVELYVPTPTRGVSDEVRREYRNIKHEMKYNGRLSINRIALYKEGKNAVFRALRYFFMSIAFIIKGIKSNADLVFIYSTPPTQGLIAGIIGTIKKIPVIYNLQDIFPDSLVNTGMTKRGSTLWKVGRIIEDYSYRHASKIIVISPSFKRNIMNKGVHEDKIHIISNWVNLDFVHPVEPRNNTLYDELSIDRNKYIVVYAGNLGEAQGAEVIIDAAALLSDYNDIQFVMFGGGSRYQEIKNRVANEKIGNVIITELLEIKRSSEVYSLGDVALITCKAGTGEAGMPSKTWSIMACNTPIIASFDIESDLAHTISEANAGICIEPGNAELLSKTILSLYKGKNDIKRNNTRLYVEKNSSKKVCVEKYISIIEETMLVEQDNMYYGKGRH